MPWTQQDHPSSLDNLHPEVRQKAIDIANAMLDDTDFDKGRVIAIATQQAENWAQARDIPLRAADAPHDSEVGNAASSTPLHVTPRDRGWAVIREGADRAGRVFDTKREATEHARQRAKAGDTHVVIHDDDGRIEGTAE